VDAELNTPRPSGIVCPLATPLTADETLDEAAFRKLLDLVVPDLDGALVLGSSGEFALLRDEVALQAMEVTVEAIDGRIPVYAGIGDTGTERALTRMRRAIRAGVDYVLLTTPFYYAVADEDALVQHYVTIADAAEVPVLIYNIPQNTHVHLTPALIARLAEHPNIIGMKDSWGDMIQFQKFLPLISETFSVFQGREELAASSLWLGADGVVSAMNNFVPGMFQRLRELVAAGDHEAALVQQTAITDLSAVFQHGYWISAMKTVLEIMGIGDGRVAMPLPPTTDEQRASIRRVMEDAGLA
jgi:dihydrodipicolinate synthase/N-acetylneuraminate lyase